MSAAPCARGSRQDADGEPSNPSRAVQTALAVVALVGLAVGVYLAHGMVGLFGASVAENQLWSARRLRYASVRQHAADMTAPGNDIFQSRNVRPETRKFYTSRAVLNHALADSRRDLLTHLPAAAAVPLLEALAGTRRAVKPLVAEVRRIFQAFRTDDIDTALRRQATMNRRANALRAAFASLDRALGEVEDGRLAAQAEAASRLAVAERSIALLLLAGVGGVLAYGRRADRQRERLARERQASVTALRESEAQKSAVLTSSLDAIVTIDADGRVLEFNPAAERIFGFARDAIVGRALEDTIMPPAVRGAGLRELIAEVAAGRSPLVGRRIEVTAQRATGEMFPAELAICLTPGVVSSFTATLRDITERKRFEADLAAARDDALAAVRLKSEFVANMSHEIRTPMNIIFGMAEMLRDSSLSTEQHAHVGVLQRNAEGLLRIIDDVLDFSKIEAGRVALETIPFALGELIAGALDGLGTRARAKGLVLEACVDAALGDVAGDPTRLRQVVLNLVDNAIKFTERGGVTVAVTRERMTPEVVVVRVAVADTGIGIPPDKRAAVFEAFAQADGTTTRRFGGTGLGLTISLQLVTLMGGRMWLESEEGAGSRFVFDLPLRRVDGARQPLRAVG